MITQPIRLEYEAPKLEVQHLSDQPVFATAKSCKASTSHDNDNPSWWPGSPGDGGNCAHD